VNSTALGRAWLQAGKSPAELRRVFHTFNAGAAPFAQAGRRHDPDD
jgi:hypothetical protein